MISRPYFGSKNSGSFFEREHDVNSPIERLCPCHDAFRGGSASMILFSSVGHGLIEAIRQGFPIRVGALADRVRPPLLAGEGRGQLCLAVRSEPVGAWSGGCQACSASHTRAMMSLKPAAIWGVSV
jgi:hypothetical protein